MQAFKEQELPGDLAKRIKQHELEKLRTDTKQAQEEWQRRRELEQNEAFQRQREELERLKEKLREMERRRENNPASPAQQQQVHIYLKRKHMHIIEYLTLVSNVSAKHCTALQGLLALSHHNPVECSVLYT